MKLIVGLGNPGDQYLGTRHNLGFLIVDHFARGMGSGGWNLEKKFTSEVIYINPVNQPPTSNLILAKPQTSMNKSGLAVSKLTNYYKIDPKDMIVIHDDLDLLLGKIKIRLGGGAAGHHGVESIIEALGTDQFIRVRIGIGNSAGFGGEHKRTSFNAEKFVVEFFEAGERSKIKSATKQVVAAIETLLTDGLEKVQNQFN